MTDTHHTDTGNHSPHGIDQLPAELSARTDKAEAELSTWLRRRPRLAALSLAVAGVVVKQSYYRLSLSAAGAAFWLVIAIFPAVFAAIMIFGLVVSQEQLTDWLNRASLTYDQGITGVVADQAEQVMQTEPSSLSLGLAISLALTLWSASAGAYALLRSVRMAYGLAPQAYVVARARGVAATLVAVLGLGLLTWIGIHVRRWLSGLDGLAGLSVTIGLAVVAFVVLVTAVAITFRFAIAMPTPIRCLLPGAALTALAVALILGAATAFGSYVTHYQATYGALTSMVVTLLVLYTLMYATLLAALFNALWSPLPTSEFSHDGTPDAQWQRLEQNLQVSPAPPTAQVAGPPSDTLPQPEDDPAAIHDKQTL